MIAFDVEKLESNFPEIHFMIPDDDDGKPFLALRFKDGEFSGVVWSYSDIQVKVIAGYVDVNFGKVVYVNPDEVDIGNDSEFVHAIGELLDDMLEHSVKNE